MTAVETFAEWLAAASSNHGGQAYRRACDAVVDTVGCTLAGSGSAAATAVQATIRPWGAGQAAVLGTAMRVPAPWAALANGTAAHALDFDDCDAPANSHPSAVLVPALIALGEERGLTGAAVLDAYIVGLEVQMRIGKAINLAHYHQGWHSTSTIGAIAAAAACARLLRLDAERSAHAISIASSRAGGFQAQFGTMTKPAHAGFAAAAGLVAAGLAETGLTASPEALDGKAGVQALLADERADGFGEPLAKLGKPLGILQHGLIVKRYPCCSYIHRAVDGLLALRTRHQLTAEQVCGVTVEIPGKHKEILPFITPNSPTEARFCMPYCVATTLSRGSLGANDFSEDAIDRSEVCKLISRIEFRGLPITEASSDLASLQPDRVTIRTNEGAEHSIEVLYAKGDPHNPLDEQELLAKFESCAATVLSPAAITAAQNALFRLEQQVSLSDVTQGLMVTENATRSTHPTELSGSV